MATNSHIDYNRFLNAISQARKPNIIREINVLFKHGPEGTISMGGGYPNPDLFPYKEAEFKLDDGTILKLTANELKTALDYSSAIGMPPLRRWIHDLQKQIHNPPTMDLPADDPSRLEFCITPGSQDAMAKAFEAIISPGDSLLIEDPGYAGALSVVTPLAANLVSLPTDKHGIDPIYLRKILAEWPSVEADNSSSHFPRVLYCVPNGCNPTGCDLTYERKCEIYKLAQKYNLLILEDDPYYFLQFIKPRKPSFLSMDVDGRVLRLDSFSKIISSGLRIGVITGPHALLERIKFHMHCSAMHCSSMSQVMLYKLLEYWGMDGFLSHANKAAEFYRCQRDHAIKAAEKHLTGLAEWNVPLCGMFLWLKLNRVPDTYHMIMDKALKKGVLFIPGVAFSLDGSRPSQFLRVCYSLNSPVEMDTAFSRLAAMIREEQNVENCVSWNG